MPTFGNNTVLQESRWTAFKAVAVTAKGLPVQYEDKGTVYDIFALDGLVIYRAQIFKGSVPVNSDYTQVQNDLDKADFEGNFLTKSNQPSAGTVQVSNFIFSNGTVTASGSTVLPNLTAPSLTLLINIKNAPTGTTPSITFSIQDIDPVDQTTVLGTATTGAALTGIATQELIATVQSSAVKVSWVVTGTTPSFTGVNVSVAQKSSVANVTVTGASAVTATQGPAAALSGGWPVKVTDGTNTQPTGDAVARAIFHKVTDGTNTAAVKAASTAAVATDPALVVAISPNNTVPVSATSLPLPTGAATETTLGTRLADATFTNRINTLGQKTMANSTPVVISSDQSAIPVSGTVTANIGTSGSLALDATLTGGTQRTKLTDGTTNAAVKAPSTAAVATDPALVVAISPNNAISVAQSGSWTNDVSDRAGRLVGVVYGSQGQQIKQTATNFNLQAELAVGGTLIDPRSIRALTNADVVSAQQSGSWTVTANIGTSGALALDATLTGGTARTKITDGTTNVAVKAASTAAVAADPAVVVAVSPNNTVAVTQSGSWTNDVSDRAARLVGVVYGSQGQQIKQTATNFNLQAELAVGGTLVDPRAIRALTNADVVSAQQSGTWTVTQGTAAAATAPWAVRLSDGAAFYTAPSSTQLPAALVGARLDINNGAWLGSTAPTVGSKTSANSIPVVIASDQGAIPISGSVTATNPSVGSNAAAIPTSSTQVGGSDGTNLQAVRVFDADSGAGTQWVLGTTLRKSASGGSVEAGTATDPLRTDPTGTTTQPISAAALPLPTGAATETTLGTRLADTTFTNRINTLGQKTSANSTPVVIASDQSALPVSGTVTANIGTSGSLALDATLTGGTARTKITDGTTNAAVKAASTAAVAADPAVVVAISPNNTIAVTQSGTWTNAQGTAAAATAPWSVRLSDGTAFYTAPSATQLPAALVGARLDINNGAWLGSTAPTVGSKTSANSIPVVIASDQGAVAISGTVTATNPSVGANNAAIPTSSTQVGGSDGTNIQAVRIFDADSGAGTQWVLGATLRKSASGGSVEAGTATDPLRTDPTGTTTQPISAASLPLPTGAATETTLGTRLADATFTGRINTLGQKTSANSTPVVLASDQSAIPVSGTVTANIGTSGALALDATLTGGTQRSRITDGTTNVAVKAASTTAVAADPAMVVAISPNNTVAVTQSGTWTNAQGTAAAATAPWSVRLSDGTAFYTAPAATQLPAALVGGRLDNNIGAWLGSTAPTVGSKTSANSLPVVIASDQGAVPVSGTVTANIGTSGALALDATLTGGTQRTKITDGTTNAAVKAASTAAVAADPALVVTVSPNNSISITAASLPLPTGAATETTLGTRLADATFTNRINTLGQKTMANSTPVVISSDQSAIPVTLAGLTLPFTVIGNVAVGAATSGAPVLMGASDGTNVRYIKIATNGDLINRITDGTNTAAVKAASTPATTADPALVVALSPNAPANPTITGTLTALNSAVTLSSAGIYTFGGIITGTWVGVITAESTVDGTNWVTCRTANKSTNDIIQTYTANDSFEFYSVAGSTAVRVRMSTYTSGTATATITGTQLATDAFLNYSGTDNDAAPPLRHVSIATLSTDGTLHSIRNSNTTPDGTEYALITRNIPSGTQQIGGQAQTSAAPDPGGATTSTGSALFDVSGNLQIRGQVTTDEGSFRDDFIGANLATNLTGTATFTNGSTTVTGVGTTFLSNSTITTDRYIKVAAQSDTFYVRIAEILSDTSIVLASPYAGANAASATAAVTYWAPTSIGTGSVSVATSEALLTPGTGATGSIFITHTGDYLPYVGTFRVRITQRIANQTTVFGFQDVAGNPQQQAVVVFDGTTNTTAKFRTSFSSAVADIQETTFTLPNSVNTSATNRYEIDLTQDSAALLVNGNLVASHNNKLPAPYTPMVIVAGITNTAGVTATTFAVDTVFFSNVDQVQVDSIFNGAPLVVGGQDSGGQTRPMGVVLDRSQMLAGVQAGLPVMGQSGGVGRIMSVNRLGHVQPGYQTMLALDPIEGTTVNSWLWTQSAATMTIAQTTGVLTLNNNATTTTTTSAIVTTNRQFQIVSQSSVGLSFRASISQTTNAVQELGFGAPTGTTAIINNGAFFRISNSGQVRIVTSYNGTENASAVLGTLVSTSYYIFYVVMEDNGARFVIEDSSGIPLVDTSLPLGLTTPDKAAVSHVPAFARVYTTGAAGAAPTTKISSFQAWQYGINGNKPWSEQMAISGRSANINPTTFAQTAQLTAGTAPTTTTPTNTTVAYTALGGEFVLNATASSENLLGVFGFTIPSPYTFVLTDVIFPPPMVSTALGAVLNVQEWALMVANSTNPSTATGQRSTLGLYSAAQSAPVGTVYSGQTVSIRFQTPITVLPGQVLMVLVKLLSGSATGAYRGSILLNGYYE